MKTKIRTTLTALCATAALLAIPTAASAASVGTISVKAPACSKSSTATVTFTAKAPSGYLVEVIAATNTLSTAQLPKLYFLKSLSPPSVTGSASGKVPVGKKIFASASMGNGQSTRFASKAFTVKKCAAFTG